jgi:transposase
MNMNKNDKDAYIKHLENENAKLRKRIEVLEAEIKEIKRLLGMNSQNSSQPPSLDGPEVPKPENKRKVRRKRGAKKGHEPHMRKQFPPEDITKTVLHEPHACTCGCEDLEECDEEPLRHQTVDMPPVKPIVIEHVQYVRKCKKCGELVYAPLPDDIRRNIFGPGVLSLGQADKRSL